VLVEQLVGRDDVGGLGGEQLLGALEAEQPGGRVVGVDELSLGVLDRDGLGEPIEDRVDVRRDACGRSGHRRRP
jgi:hypothetical protein